MAIVTITLHIDWEQGMNMRIFAYTVSSTKKCPLRKAEGTMLDEKLLQGLINGNSHGNGHTDQGVVACAQEAHHLNVKSALRRLCACGAGTF